MWLYANIDNRVYVNYGGCWIRYNCQQKRSQVIYTINKSLKIISTIIVMVRNHSALVS